MPGVQVDGNDVIGVRAVMEQALARARGGDGPTVVEAVTYRSVTTPPPTTPAVIVPRQSSQLLEARAAAAHTPLSRVATVVE